MTARLIAITIWATWTLRGHLITLNDYAYPPGYIYSILIRQQQLSELKQELRIPRQLLL